LTVAITRPHADVLRSHLEKLLHPLLVLLMVFARALWAPAKPLYWLLVPVVVIARLAFRRLSMNSLAATSLDRPPATRLLGSGLWAPGTFAVAIAISGALRFPEFSDVFLTTVLVGTLFSELFSFRALRRLLDDAGELAVEVQEPSPPSETAASTKNPIMQ